MIKINKNYQIEIDLVKENLVKKKLIKLKIYKNCNALNGSWKWLNNKRVTSLMDKGHQKNTLKDQLNYFKKISKSNNDLLFAIYFRKKHIGNVGLHKINLKSKTAQFGILIGNTNYHNKGIGKRVWFEVIRFGFTQLKLNKIYTMIVSRNIASNKIAKFLGFKKLKKKFYLKKNEIIFDYPKYLITPRLFRKKI